MEIVYEKAQKPLRQLRKSLKKFSENPTVEEIHNLRTRARRVEAVASALNLNPPGKTHKLLQSVKPLHQAAGQARDTDVLMAHVLELGQAGDRDGLVFLAEHLGQMRREHSEDLIAEIERRRSKARRRLKRYSEQMEQSFHGEAVRPVDEASGSANIVRELARWPQFSESNIHDFRKKAKELHYMLQLSAQPEQGLVRALNRVKDVIGEWHDWSELAKIARSVLDPEEDRELLVEIEQTAGKKLEAAIAAASDLRRRHFLQSAAQPGKRVNGAVGHPAGRKKPAAEVVAHL